MSVDRDSTPQSGGTLMDQPSQNSGPGIDNNFDEAGEEWNANDLNREDGEDAAYADRRQQDRGPDDEGVDDEGGDNEERRQDARPPVDAIPPPANWPDQEKQFFSGLPPELQHAYMARARFMQSDYTKKTQEIANIRRNYQELDRVIAPRLQQWAMNGQSPATAVAQLITLSDFAAKQPQEFIQEFARARGIDLQNLVNPEGEGDEYIDPQVSGLQQRINELENIIQQSHTLQQAQTRQQNEQRYQAAFNQTAQGIDAFARQTDQRTGQPLYPFFDYLMDDMSGLLESGRAQNLAHAYEMAQWANPETRKLLFQRQQVAQNQEQRRRAESARRAASSLTGAHSNGAAQPSEQMSIRQLLEAQMAV